MKFNYKKITAIATSVLMLGMGAGIAGAANYPAPFVSGGVADVAIVYGTGAGVSDLDQVGSYKISQDLQSFMGAGSSSTSTSISGEAVALFSGSDKLFINDSLNSVKSIITKTDLPTILASESFSGDVTATITQTIDTGTYPTVVFAKQPTNEDEPTFGLKLDTSTGNYIYNETATFSKAINFTHADTEGEDLKMFGQEFTIAAASDSSQIVLLKSAEKLALTSDTPSADVTIGGKTYTVELVSASDTAATIKVTDSTGVSEQKEVNEAASKRINGLTVAVSTADETNLKLSASIIAGSEKITLKNGNNVKLGETDTTVKGTRVTIGGTTGACTSIILQVAAPESDKDSLKSGESFVDPVFGTIKLDFKNGMSIKDDDTTKREDIKLSAAGDDKVELTMTDYNSNTKVIQIVQNVTNAKNSTGAMLAPDDNGKNITVIEGGIIHYGGYVIVGNEADAHLVELTSVSNDSDTYTGDEVEFTDVFSGDTYTTTFSAEQVGTIPIGGRSYTVNLGSLDSTASSEAYNVTLGYPDTATATDLVIYPTIKTSKGAKIALYEPLVIPMGANPERASVAMTGVNAVHMNVTKLEFPDGDGYTPVTMAVAGTTSGWTSVWNLTYGTTICQLNTSILTGSNKSSCAIPIGQLKYNFTVVGGVENVTSVQLLDATETANINEPAVVIFEEKDDASVYNAQIISIEDAGAGIGISTIDSTWADNDWSDTTVADSKITKGADRWGVLYTLDGTDSDRKDVAVSYPDEQVYADLYIAAEAANIVTSSSSAAGAKLGSVVVKDSEISSVSSKNLVVVGGSCINSVAATLVGEAACSARFTELTTVGVGKYIIKGYADKYTTGKLALLVAGYEAADTVAAVDYLTTTGVDTSAEKIGP